MRKRRATDRRRRSLRARRRVGSNRVGVTWRVLPAALRPTRTMGAQSSFDRGGCRFFQRFLSRAVQTGDFHHFGDFLFELRGFVLRFYFSPFRRQLPELFLNLRRKFPRVLFFGLRRILRTADRACQQEHSEDSRSAIHRTRPFQRACGKVGRHDY